ncbi:Probable terpene synthase 3 [Linum perenne]
MLLLVTEENKSADWLNLINAIQRLGISYHFEPEIELLVQQVGIKTANDDDLHTVALRFMILRQHGHNVPTDGFKEFKDEQGEFKKELADDIEGLLSLYEAAHMRTHGEILLDEAMNFTKTHLNGVEFDDDEVDFALADRVARALKRPLRKDMEKLQHLFFITNYEKIKGHNGTLLKLAKLSFNVLQHMYQHELRVLTKWWTELDFATKVLYARDKLVETYYWAVGMFWEPKFALARYFVTKGTTLGTVLDDTYDVYGTIDELELFTSKFARWEAIPEDLDISLKYVYQAVMDFNHEIEAITSEEGRPYCFQYAKRALAIDLTAYLDEQRWYDKGIVPSLEEYRKVSAVTSFYMVIMNSGLCGMGELASKEVFDWLLADPNVLFASGDHCRLMDDIVSHERGHVPSAVQIYLKQYGATTEEAVRVLNGMIDDDWRTMNGESLIKITQPRTTTDVDESDHEHGTIVIPKEIVTLFVRMAQNMEVIYKEIDGYTCSNTVTKDNVTALFVTPLHI